MWVATQAAGQTGPTLQTGPDAEDAFVYGAGPTDRGQNGAYLVTSFDAPIGSFSAAIDRIDATSSSSPAIGSIVKTSTVTQTVTGPASQLVITPGTDGGPPPRFSVGGGPDAVRAVCRVQR